MTKTCKHKFVIICNHLDWYAKLARRAEYSCDVFGTADRHGVIASFELFGFTEAQCKGTVTSGLSSILHDFGVTMCGNFSQIHLAYLGFLK